MVSNYKKRIEQRDKYFPELELYIEKFGIMGTNLHMLSRQWLVPRSTLVRWKKEIIAKRKKEAPFDSEVLGYKLTESLEIAGLKLMESIGVVKAEDMQKVTQGTSTLLRFAKGIRETAEEFGLKAKAPQTKSEDTPEVQDEDKMDANIRQKFEMLDKNASDKKTTTANTGN